MGIVWDLAVEVGKYLLLPVLALSQLSETSYCAHERKLVLVPIPFLVGFAVAGVMKDTAAEVSSDLKVCIMGLVNVSSLLMKIYACCGIVAIGAMMFLHPFTFLVLKQYRATLL